MAAMKDFAQFQFAGPYNYAQILTNLGKKLSYFICATSHSSTFFIHQKLFKSFRFFPLVYPAIQNKRSQLLSQNFPHGACPQFCEMGICLYIYLPWSWWASNISWFCLSKKQLTVSNQAWTWSFTHSHHTCFRICLCQQIVMTLASSANVIDIVY